MSISWEITKNMARSYGELNPDLYDNRHLKPEVREKLLDIANEFENNFSIKLDIIGVNIIGSNAGFNWTDSSDIDLHLITDYNRYPSDIDILDELFNAKKNNFNNNYDISIYNFPVEIYVEDVNHPAETNGRYSVDEDLWIQEPSYVAIPEVNDELYEEYTEKIESAISNPSIIDYLIDEIWDKRKESIKRDGFTGEFNLVFKKLRSEGYLDRLRQANFDYKSEQLSLE